MVLAINSTTGMAKHTKKVFSQAYIPKIWCEQPNIWRIKKVLYPDIYRGSYKGGEVPNTDNAQINYINALYQGQAGVPIVPQQPGVYQNQYQGPAVQGVVPPPVPVVPAAAMVTAQNVQS